MLFPRTLTVILVVLSMTLIVGRPAVASMSPGLLRLGQVVYLVEQDADGLWRHGGQVSMRWAPAGGIVLGGSAEAWQTLSSCELIRAGAALVLTIGSGKFVLQIPGMLKRDDTGTTGRLGLTASPRWGALDAMAGVHYEHRSSDRPELVNGRLKGGLDLSVEAGPGVYSGSVECAFYRVPAVPEQDYVFIDAEGGCRFRLGPKAYLKAGIEWAGYAHPNAPRSDNSRFEVTGEWGRYLDQGRLSAGIEAEYGQGLLSNRYLYGLLWGRLTVQAGAGRLTASVRLDGRRHLDPLSEALDTAEWKCGAGYTLTAGAWTVQGTVHYSFRLLETGGGEWVLGPQISLAWQPGESWQTVLEWAPEGDLTGNDRGLRVQIRWAP